MADAGTSELDADYTEIDTYEEVKNVTANNGAHRLTTYLDIKAGEDSPYLDVHLWIDVSE